MCRVINKTHRDDSLACKAMWHPHVHPAKPSHAVLPVCYDSCAQCLVLPHPCPGLGLSQNQAMGHARHSTAEIAVGNYSNSCSGLSLQRCSLTQEEWNRLLNSFWCEAWVSSSQRAWDPSNEVGFAVFSWARTGKEFRKKEAWNSGRISVPYHLLSLSVRYVEAWS